MNPFDKLVEPIPRSEAAAFFIGLKKFAEWTDPPDETGELEGMFSIPVEQVLAKLTEVITAKFRLAMAYRVYGQTFRDHAWRAVKIEFYEHAEDELCSAEYYTKRSTALGGPVHINEIEPPPATTKPIDILKIMARAEQEAIALQRTLRSCVGDENPMKVGIEEQLNKDQHHLDELWQMMEEQEKNTTPVIDVGAPQDVEMPGEEDLGIEQPEAEAAEEPVVEEPVEKAASEADDYYREMYLEEMANRMREQAKLQLLQGKMNLAGPEGHQAIKDELIAQGTKGGKWGGGIAGGLLGAAGGGALGGMVHPGVGIAGALGGGIGGAILGARSGAKSGKRDAEDLITRAYASPIAPPVAKEAAARFKLAMQKVAQPPGPGADGAVMSSPAPAEGGAPGAEQMMDPSMMGMPPPVKPPVDATPQEYTGREGTLPTNYLAVEQQAQQAQQQNEANFYRSRMQEAQAQASGMQQQVSDVQNQLNMLQQQVAESGAQIQQATQTAMQAQDEALKQTQMAANMRMGMQRMQQQMIDIASQPVEQMGGVPTQPVPGTGEAAMAASQGAVGPDGQPMDPSGMESPDQAAMAQQGPAGQAPPAGGGVPPASPPAGAGVLGGGQSAANAASAGPVGADMAGAQPQTQMKAASIEERFLKAANSMLPALLGGGALGALGAGMALRRGQQAPALRQKVQDLEGQDTGGFAKALEIAKAKSNLAQAELAEQYPERAALMGGLKGATLGALAGPGIGRSAARLAGNLGEVGRQLVG